MLIARRWFHLPLVLMIVVLHLPPRLTYAQDNRPAQVVASLRAFARTLGLLALSPELQRPLPLSYVSPAYPEGLRLSTVFTETLDSLPPAPASLDELQQALQGIQGRDVGGVSVTLSHVSVAPSPEDPALIDVAFSFDAARAIAVPLIVVQPPLVVTGGSYPADLRLTTRLQLQVDTRTGALTVVGVPTITIAMQSHASIAGGRGQVGFADVTLAGDVVLNAAAEARMADPDRSGRITQDEWAFTAPEDLFQAAYLDQPGDDINTALTITAAPVGGAPISGVPSATLALVDPNLADGLAQPAAQLGALADFGNITPSQMLSGLQAFTAALGTAQVVGDPRLPFADTRLISTTALVEPLVTFIRHHGDAAIICGAQPGSPLSGDPSNLGPGAPIYCQAIALKRASVVKWHLAGSEDAVDTNSDTVGPNPTATAQLTVPAGGIEDIRVTFNDDTGPHTVQPMFRSAQELYAHLSKLPDFDPINSGLAFDPTTSSLTYRLVLHPQLAPRPFNIDVGDMLKSSAGIANMRQRRDVATQISVSDLDIDTTFGVILEPKAADVGVDGRNDDRFFLKVHPGRGEYEISANATLSGQIDLDGQIGYLAVEAKAGETPLAISADDPSKMMLALDITTPVGGIARPGRPSIADAITLSELLAHPSNYVQPAQNLKLHGDLRVEANVNSHALGAGALSIDWPSNPAVAPAVTLSADFQQRLKIFYDLTPDDPAALKSIVLDSLQALLDGLGTAGGDQITVPLPVIGRSPKQLLEFEALQTTIAALRRESVGSLQALTSRINASMGSGSDILGFELNQATTPAELVILLRYTREVTRTIQFNLALPDAPALIAAEGQASPQLAYRVNTDIRFSVPLTPVAQMGNMAAYVSHIQVAANSSASVEAKLEASGIQLSIGARALRLAADGNLRFGARIELNDPSAPADTQRTLAAFIQSLRPQFGSINGFAANSCGDIQDATLGRTVALTGDICAKLALRLEINGTPTANVGDLGFRIEHAATLPTPDTNLADPAEWYVRAPQLDTIISDPAQALNWDQLNGSLPELLRALETALKASKPLPMIGDDLQAGANVVKDIRDHVVTPLNNLNAELGGVTDPASAVQKIKQRLLNPQAAVTNVAGAARAASPASLVKDRNGDGAVDENDIDVTFLPAGAPLPNVNEVQVSLILGQDDEDARVPFNLGVEGVPFAASGGLQSKVGWSLPLVFGMSRNIGPYIGQADPNTPALALDLHSTVGLAPTTGVALPAPLPPVLQGYTGERTITTTLGFLDVKWYDNIANPTQLGLQVGLKANSTTGREPVERIGALLSNLTPDVHTTARLDLLFRAGMDHSAGGQLPAVLGTVTLPDLDAFGSTHAEEIFKNLHVDVGGFAKDFLDPVFDSIDQVTRPIKPVVDALYAPIPGISDLSRMTTGKNISLINLLKTNVHTELIDNLAQVARVSGQIKACLGGGIIPIPPECNLGVQRSAARPASLVVPIEAFAGQDAGAVMLRQIAQADGAANHATSAASAQALNLPNGLSFPFLESPQSIVGLLLGKDIVLMRFDAGKLRGEGGINHTFPPIMVGPIPISIGISATVAVEGRFAMGYDTVGLRQAANRHQAVSLIDGLFIDDRDDRGADVPEIALIGTAAVSAAVDAFIVAAGIKGGIELTLGLNLHDTEPQDGRLHFDEIGARLNNPICLFDATGRLAAFLSAFVRVGFSFFGETFDFRIAEVTLVDFSEDLCAKPQPPSLAELVGNDVVLNMGPRAGNRNIPNASTDTNEKFIVRQISPENAFPPGVGGGTRISISAFGVYEEKTVLQSGQILADAGVDDDTIALEPGANIETKQPITFTLSADLHGGPGNDELKGATGNDTLHGDAGNDTLSGDAGVDSIFGGDDDDVIDAGLGDDRQIFGEAGNDVMTGGSGADTLDGGIGNDRLSGGPGTNILADPVSGRAATPGISPDLDDILIGGPGNDSIDGGFGNDTLYGNEEIPGTSAERCAADGAASGAQSDNDLLLGGLDDDQMFGGVGNDRIAGQDGNDYGCGNAGDDTIDGDGEGTATTAGNDWIDGGPGNDILHAQAGDDNLFGRTGDDQLFGDDGNDNLSGGRQTDRLFGGAGRDYLFGDDGQVVPDATQPDGKRAVFAEDNGEIDFIHGDAADDVIYGEGGDDQLWGDAGRDLMYGNGGDDHMRGGTDDDRMFGNANNDTMDGDSGLDQMYGNTGNDLMRGGIGDDYMEGNEGTDTMDGDADQDDMLGGTSTAGIADADDTINGGAQHDYLAGDNAQIMRPGGINSFDGSVVRSVTLLDIDSPDPSLSGGDHMFGGDGNDRMWGQGGGDSMRGGGNDDFMQGNAAGDSMYGDAGQDDMLGGSDASGRSDGADDIHGGDGQIGLASDFDVIAGDNALILRPLTFGVWRINYYNGSTQRQVTLLDEVLVGGADNPAASGGDTIDGDGADDLLFGQGGGDTLRGGGGDDYLEGDSGADTLSGGTGQDDIIGGSAAPGRVDAGDTIYGGDGQSDLTDDHDVITGDNAAIARPLLCGQWQLNAFDNSIVRNVTLFEVASVGQTVVVRGNDQIAGEGGDDRIYGQGGNDRISGDVGDDYIEGNADDDTIDGGFGNDDLIGGTGRINGDGSKGVDGRLDGRDTIDGGVGFDTIAGDNAILARKLFDQKKTPACPPNTTIGVPLLVGGRWRQNSYNGGIQHESRILLDRNSPNSAVVGGDDSVTGGDDDDVIYGQAGNDTLSGGAGDDIIEGNAGSDTIAGDDGSDDMVGGTAQNGSIDDTPDFIRGDAGDDVLAGDNARINRPLDKQGQWKRDKTTGVVLRDVTLDDVQVKGKRVDPHFSSWDGIEGGAGYDTVLGQGGDDILSGDGDPDYMEGNAGADVLYGGSGKDRMIGGGSGGDGKIGSGKNLKDLTDGTNTLDGGGDGDVMIQGNGVIH